MLYQPMCAEARRNAHGVSHSACNNANDRYTPKACGARQFEYLMMPILVKCYITPYDTLVDTVWAVGVIYV